MNIEESRKNSYENKIKEVKKNATIIAVTASVIMCGIGIGIGSKIKSSKDPNISQEMYNFLQYYDSFKNNYYIEQDERTLIDGLYYGLTSSVNDDFTFYVSSMNNESQGLQTSGVGIGFSRSIYYGNAKVEQVMKNSPAAKALYLDNENNFSGAEEDGLKQNDLITKVKEFESEDEYYVLKDHEASDWSKHFSGESGSRIEIVLLRDGRELRYVVTRGAYNQDKVKLIEKDFTSTYKQAVVAITTFLGNSSAGETTPAGEMIDLFKKDLFNGNDYIDNLVIDLRGNGGGYVNNFTDLMSLFVGKNQICGYYYYPRTNEYTKLEPSNYIYSYDGWSNYNSKIGKYTLLIDENTASASESFVMGMRDTDSIKDKVTVVGEISYGKGIAQSFYYPYADEYDYTSSIRYTSAKVVSPKKNSINKRGIVPDVMIESKYRSIQNVDDYDFWRKEIVSIDDSKDKAIVLGRLEALLDMDFNGNIENALLEYQSKKTKEPTGIYDEETMNLLNDEFFDYYHKNKPYNIYDACVYGNSDVDSFTPTQRRLVKEQIQDIMNKSYTSFYNAVVDFKNTYSSEIEDDNIFGLPTSYYLQGKIKDVSEELDNNTIKVAMNHGA